MRVAAVARSIHDKDYLAAELAQRLRFAGLQAIELTIEQGRTRAGDWLRVRRRGRRAQVDEGQCGERRGNDAAKSPTTHSPAR